MRISQGHKDMEQSLFFYLKQIYIDIDIDI